MGYAVVNRCQAKAKKTGKQCKNSAVNGYEVCRLHGGKTPRGVNAGSHKHGRYSKDLPTRLSKRFQESINDPALTQNHAEIALMDTRIGDLVSSLVMPSKEMMGGLVDSRDGIKDAMRTGDSGQLLSSFNQLNDTIEFIIGDNVAWNEIVKLVEQRRKLVETEQKIALHGERAISIEQFMLLMGAIFKTIETIVKSQDERIAVAREIRNVLEISN